MTYLEINPPARRQYRLPRRATPTGAIVVHTAETQMDLDGPDGAAEAVARFIQRRLDGPGSYHALADSDSWVHLVPYNAEAFGESTGGNRWALHLSFACRASDWRTMGTERRQWMLSEGAYAASDMARWLQAEHNVTVPAIHIAPTAYRAGRAGFVGHGELDPGRRSDPGARFPWGEFLAAFQARMETPAMQETPAHAIQRALNANGAQPPLAVDGVIGPRTVAALGEVLRWLNHQVTAAQTRPADETARTAAALEQARRSIAAGLDTITELQELTG